MADDPKTTASNESKEFAARLAAARRRLYPNMSEFAKRTSGEDVDPEGKGISRTALLEYERGTYRPGTRELRILCDSLKVTPNFLIYGNEEPFHTAASALAAIKNANNEQLEVFAIAAFVSHLDEESRRAHLQLLENSVKACTTQAEFNALVGVIRAMASDGQEVMQAIEKLADPMIERAMPKKSLKKIQKRADELAAE